MTARGLAGWLHRLVQLYSTLTALGRAGRGFSSEFGAPHTNYTPAIYAKLPALTVSRCKSKDAPPQPWIRKAGWRALQELKTCQLSSGTAG